jgi:hypothetical protein
MYAVATVVVLVLKVTVRKNTLALLVGSLVRAGVVLTE